MPRAADGQYEMVLENRHVMTLFFVVIVLCGVFFGLGYIVGKNTVGTAATTAQQQEAAAKEEGKKNPPEAAGKKAEPASPDLTFQKTLEGKGAAPGLETAQPASQPQTAGSPAPAGQPAETKPSASPAASPAQQSSAPAAIIQVGALKNRADADSMASTLKSRGFAPVVEQQTDGLFHIFIPVSSPADAEDMKARVEKAGFKAFIKKK